MKARSLNDQQQEKTKAAPPAPAQRPSIGRIVHYRISQREVEDWHIRRIGSGGRYYGDTLRAGQVLPLMIVRVDSPVMTAGLPVTVNGQLFLDGNDCVWLERVPEAREQDPPGSGWFWPART